MKSVFPHNHATKNTCKRQSSTFAKQSRSFYCLQFPLCNFLCLHFHFSQIQGEKNLSLLSRREESQSSDRHQNTSETSFTQGIVTLVDVSEKFNNIFDRNLASELTEPSQISKEIDDISSRLTEQNNPRMSQIQEQLNSKFEDIRKAIRTNRNYNLTTMKRMPRTTGLVFFIPERNFKYMLQIGENTHQLLKMIEKKDRIITSSIRKRMNKDNHQLQWEL